MVNIQIIKPSQVLQSYIDCYSCCKGEFAETKMRVIANSCTTLFIYLNGSKHSGQFDKRPVSFPYGIISPYSLRKNEFWSVQSQEVVECITIMFSYMGFYRLFGIPMRELFGSIYNLSDVSLPGFREVIAKVEEANDNVTRAAILDTYFIRQYSRLDRQDIRNQYIPKILSHIRTQMGKLNVRELCEQVSMTERTLENWFKTCIGVSPSEFIHIIKFHNLLNELYHSNVSNINWQDWVHNYRYYDQAHLINTFKDATSVTPDYFFKNKKTKLFLASNGSGCLFFNEKDDYQMLKEIT